MKFWGWVLRIMVIASGIGLFLLQSQFAKKSILEFVINQPFKNSTLRVEAKNIRGLFPFHITVASLELKEGSHHLATLSDTFAVWSVPALINGEIKVKVAKGEELAGDITYVIGKHALFSTLDGTGLPLGSKGLLKSVVIDFPALDLLTGQVVTRFYDGQETATLTLKLEELDEDRLKVQEIILAGQAINGKGYGVLYPRQGMWEGEADIAVAALASYDQWFQKGLAGSATLKCQKPLKGQLNLDLRLEQFRYGYVGAKALNAQATGAGTDHMMVTAQGQEILFNTIPLTKLSATGSFDKKKGHFEITGVGKKNISFRAQGMVDFPAPRMPQTQVTLTRAELTHPMHQFALKQPTTIIWDEKSIRIPKLWLTTGGGMITVQDLIFGDDLSGALSIDRLPLTLLQVIDPEWMASGFLSGKGKLKGTMDHPHADLSLEGKSLKWRSPTHSSPVTSHRLSGIDLSSVFTLSQGFLGWQAKAACGRLLTLMSQGKLSVRQWCPTEDSSFEATLKGRGDMSVISLLMPYGDLIQGQASVDLTGTGTVKDPIIKGQVSVVNGLYENAVFGTLIKNIKLQGNASRDILILSSITGQDNAKGRVNGHGSIKFTSLLNPDVDLQLLLDQLIVVQNDEISGKAKGVLKLHGSLRGDDKTKLKITGDVVLEPLEVRLDEHEEKIITIKLLEKKKDGSYQTPVEYHSQKQLQKGSSFLPLDIKLSSPGQIYLRGYGFDAQWKGEMRAVGTITDPQLVGEMTLVRGKFELLGKLLKLIEGRITYSQEPENDPLLSIAGTREVGEITATMRIEGHASNPKITFSSSPALSQEEVLARVLFGSGTESMSVTQSLLLANTLSTLKGKNNLNFTDKIRSAFGLDVLEFKERKPAEGEDFTSGNQQVSVGKQIDKVYLSLNQSVSGERETSATILFDVTRSLKLEADVGGNKNSGVGFTWVKKY
ncbi:MAG: uncharacterized protein K0R76_588 [Alphaproteobacteria bacterium]|jgi:hypothetical protein|nr:uncharacterized protein [Alphaproteobacteria bacterium]